jgi:2-oxoglutarate ferredoxin oxidoreductase subunit alpha
MALKGEFLTLAIMVELPLVVVDVQRAGPSTGMPTKTEQADLLQALYGRFSEAPCIVIAARSPSDCFEAAYEACRLSVKHMTPVILLSDGFIANGSEPWRLPEPEALPEFPVRFRTDPVGFAPYLRDPETLARPWAVPGTPGLEHRIGGLEKAERSGNVSYDAQNHERMVRLRAEKVERVAADLPPLTVEGDATGELLVVAWGSTYGAVTSAVRRARALGREVGHVHLRHLSPLPRDLGAVLGRFDRILVPEINLGQLAFLLQGKFAIPVERLNKVQGRPFTAAEVQETIVALTGKRRKKKKA